MQFAYPQWRVFLVLALAAAALAVLALVRKRRALGRLARRGIHQPGVLVRPSRQIVKCLLLLLAAGLLGIAVLGPQWGWTEQQVPPRRGRDVVVVLDVSRSMLAEDVGPNRLQRAKADLRGLADFLQRKGGHRIGLVLFAERAMVVCPLTSDYRCFAEELADASLNSLRLRGHAAWGDGTQIRRALDRADQAIDDANAAYTDVLLVSDGEDMARETVAAAETLAHRGITVHALGLGNPEHGSLIPVRDRLGRSAHLRYRGELVYTHLQEEVLRAVAQCTHGRYFAAGTGAGELDRQFGQLLADKESREQQSDHRPRHGIHRFVWFVGPALLVLLLHWFLSEAPRRGRTAPEPPHYFSWVRRRTNHRVTENTEKNTIRNRKIKLSFFIFSFFLCVLCDSVVSSSPPTAVDPWAAFQRGNELLRKAQKAGANADPASLTRAAQQYQACLTSQGTTPAANTLFENARYNHEMAKLLLMQISRSGAKAAQPDPKPNAATNEESRRTGEDNSSSTPQQEVNTPRSPQQGQQKVDAPRSSQQKADAPRSPQQETDASRSPQQSSQQAQQQQQQQQQQSQDNPGSCSVCQSGQIRAGSRKTKPGGQDSRSGPGKSKQQNQSNQTNTRGGTSSSSTQSPRAKKEQSNAEKNKTDTAKDKPKDPGSKPTQSEPTQRQQQQSQGNAESCSVCRSGQQRAGSAARSPGAGPAPAPRLSDLRREDEQQGRGRGRQPQPDASGLFQARTPTAKQQSSRPGRGSQGDSAAGGPSPDKAARTTDAAMQAAVLRLQASIQRIAQRRGCRVSGRECGPEDPANLKRYRDW